LLNNMNIKEFEQSDWIQVWAGEWRILSCSHWGDQYTKEIKFGGRIFLKQAILFVKEGKSACWWRQQDRDALGNYLSDEVRKDNHRAVEVCKALKKETKGILKFINRYQGKEIGLEKYKEYWDRLLKYYVSHINVKYVVDYLPPELLEKLLSHFEEARVYAEPVFKRTEEFLTAFAINIGRKSGLPVELTLSLTKNEMYRYLDSGTLPTKEMLEERNKDVALLFNMKTSAFVVGIEVKTIESVVFKQTDDSIIKGTTAYKGKAIGRVRIILDPAKADHFTDGDILVTGMTRPEYLSIIKKCAAFVTDAGGILSHAAIVARELKKPCIIGTQVATKVLKDGDLVEVDADNGIVKIIKK